MGAVESQPLPPWFESAGREYATPIRDQIQALSATAAPFLAADPHYFQVSNDAQRTATTEGR
jgi:hypothetical protein